MSRQRIDRVSRFVASGASISTPTGQTVVRAAAVEYDNGSSGLAATEAQAAIDEVAGGGGGGGGAGLRAFTYVLTPAAGGKTVQVSLRVKDESGAQVAHTTHFRFDLYDDYLLNSGFAATALVGNASAGTVLNTSSGSTAYPSHFGYTTAGGTVTFNVWPAAAAVATQGYTLVAWPVNRASTTPTWAVQPLTVAFTCIP